MKGKDWILEHAVCLKNNEFTIRRRAAAASRTNKIPKLVRCSTASDNSCYSTAVITSIHGLYMCEGEGHATAVPNN